MFIRKPTESEALCRGLPIVPSGPLWHEPFFTQNGLGKRRSRFGKIHWVILQEQRLITKNVRVVGVSDLVGQGGHAVQVPTYVMKMRDCWCTGKPRDRTPPCRFPSRFSASIQRSTIDVLGNLPNSGEKRSNESMINPHAVS
ncbi:MAG: hypothetical protein CM1200mP2_57210 [Planctomycetaceae bacterium]|nr:MAG: hypothetical protein CM1200mP2_57210 [Planctomycetaceae bacterium]